MTEMVEATIDLNSLLATGDVRKILDWTGEPYAVRGIVVHGAGRGRKLNFPTANLGHEPAGQVAPRDGIYAGWAIVHGDIFGAAISIGYNPTFADGRHSIEAHLLNFDEDIYDAPLEILFVDRIREERKFDNVTDLIAQIGRDVEQCAAILANESGNNKLSR